MECSETRKCQCANVQRTNGLHGVFLRKVKRSVAILPSSCPAESTASKKEDRDNRGSPKSFEEREIAMRALPPQARIALETMAQMQKRPAEDVLRDEIRQYIAGRLPIVNIDAAIEAIQATAHTAGYLIGRLRRFAREMNNE